MSWFKNLKISKKLITGFLVVAIIAAIVGSIGIINILSIKNEDSAMYSEEALGLQYSGATAVNFMQLRYFILKASTIGNSSSDEQDVITNIQAYEKETGDSFNKFKTDISFGNNDVNALLQEISTNWDGYQKNIEQVIQYINADQNQKATELINSAMAPIGTALRDDYLKLMQLVADEASAKADNNALLAQNSIIIMIIVVVAAVAIAVLLGIYIANIIGKPVQKMAALGNLLSKGDIEIDTVLESKDYLLKQRKDEVGALALAFHELIAATRQQVDAIQKLSDGDLTIQFTLASDKDVLGKGLIALTENLNGLIGSIMTASDQVTSGAGMVSHSSMSLSQGATEQASSVEELTASLDEIATQTGMNAQNATKASGLAREAHENASAGNAEMGEMLKAMGEISASSASINKIIKVIDDIAFQTNILALNAAVEAARAGQHGKGFAVVAEEVRTLAARSADAARETTDLIEDSIKKVEAGTKIANETAGALKQIVEQVDKAADLVHSIATASTEQAAGVEQINQGIAQVSQVVQTNAATAEESAAASEELSAQAERLRETISIFKIKDAADSIRAAAPQNLARPALGRPQIALTGSGMGKY
ncbi:methyl-accepting chemotaxis protein [Sporobacter termitidis DSM 10068]|uniref:Methyl-accepting chemotaxis protein n=1 Tax=Sporobacter termitidis DSM 10068 TaxID=1123282 RepID=A0A1M5Z9N7_9FIRM|nr:methyl-accepting chemotaxis protein [Sporobacter termitidis]SHI20930.1 methyl-accepting chemotaxis protein [Sporobacter termitidis DSM 10068]